VKKVRTPSQIEAVVAARKRALFVAPIALVVAIIMLVISDSFVALQCVMAAAVALSGGIAAARAAIPIDPTSFRTAGATGGIYAGLAYALPFMGYNLFRYLSVNDQTVGARMAELSSAQLEQIRQFNIQVGAEYFRGQDISFVFGYLLFALLLGWLAGSLGGVLAKRQMAG
jgi:hypothetical protein